jgi:hypothetical protein
VCLRRRRTTCPPYDESPVARAVKEKQGGGAVDEAGHLIERVENRICVTCGGNSNT